MTPEREADIRETWENTRAPSLKPGMDFVKFPSIHQWRARRSFSPALEPPEMAINYEYRWFYDEVFREPDLLLHRRVRIICEGITVFEQIEPRCEALKRSRYQDFGAFMQRKAKLR